MFNKNIPYVSVLGSPVHQLTMDQTMSLIETAITRKEQIQHVVVNAAKLVNMQKDTALKKSVVESNIINADGQSVVWAAKFLGRRLPERVAGIDLMTNLVKLAAEKGYKVFFFGAKEAIVRKVVEDYGNLYSPAIIAGYRNGYFDRTEEPLIAKQISDSGADILFVAMTSPKKEIFLNEYKDVIKTPFIMGVGGSFDVVSGFTKRAPEWMQKNGLEWLYRVIQEPRRMWKRYLVTNTLFIAYVIKEALGKKYPISS